MLGISQPAVSLIERGTPTALTEDRFSVLLTNLEISESELPHLRKDKPAASGKHVFISYSHKDKGFLDRLMVHLRPLEKKKLIEPWADSRIVAGEKWKVAIESSLKKARAAILLISADFLASDFIVDNELPPLLKKADDWNGRYSSDTPALPIHARDLTCDIPIHQLTRGTHLWSRTA